MRLLLAILLLLIAAPALAQQGQGMSQAMVVSSCGGGALPSGALTQLTMNPQGQLCLSGIGSASARRRRLTWRGRSAAMRAVTPPTSRR